MGESAEASRASALRRFFGAASLFHIATWLPGYSRQDLRGDIVAGLTVGVMLIPQGMAYAVLAGVPPIYGLYASLVPLLVYPIFGTSRHLAVGITAIDMVIVAGGLSQHADLGTEEYIGLAIVTAMMAGFIQMLMGAARLGFVVNLLSRPVISGFTAAAALIIGVTQLKNLLGIDIPSSPMIFDLIAGAVSQISDVHLITFAIGLTGILLLVVLRRVAPLAPGPLIAVALGTLAVWLLELDTRGVEIVGVVPTGLPRPTLSIPSLSIVRELLPTAITLSLVQFMSVISLGKVFAAKHRYTVRANKELFALGALNVFGAVFRSIPVSGSFSRSAVGDQAGGRTAMTNVVAAVVIAFTLLFLTPLFYYLPIPVFASIIMVAAFGMIDYQEIRFLIRTKAIDGGIAVLTFVATIVLGITEGVLIGIAASVVSIMYRISRPNVAILGHLPGSRSFRDLARNPNAHTIEGVLLLRVDASFSFANAEFLQDLLLKESQREDTDIRAVVIDASSVNDLDTTAASVLASVIETLRSRGIEMYFGGLKGRVRDVMARYGIIKLLGDDHLHLSPHRAVMHILEGSPQELVYLDTVPEKRGMQEPPDEG
ncbi:MAG: solute carrier family 26 protein [Rhodothermales bacterium]|nr:solute carrier family 26 protein [Rhodothermales bacterium]